jgi:hypothetical protein
MRMPSGTRPYYTKRKPWLVTKQDARGEHVAAGQEQDAQGGVTAGLISRKTS